MRLALTMKVVIVCATIATATSVFAQQFPTRPVTVIIPYPAGGPTDTIGRILTARMAKALGQPVIVENVSGGAGSIGVGRVAKAHPDGYTLSFGHWGDHVLNAAMMPLAYDLLGDFQPIAWVASNPQIIVSSPAVPATNLAELLAWIRANQDKVTVATSGPANQFSTFYFQKITGTKIQVVPYRGGGPALQDVIAGHVDINLDQPSNCLSYIRAGRLKAYAVTSTKRLAAAPSIPTVEEAGLPALLVTIWHGMWAPKNTPRTVVARLNQAIVESLADPVLQQRFSELGQEIPDTPQQTPEALGRLQRAEAEKWWPIVKESGVKWE